MKPISILAIALAVSTVTNFAQTTPAPTSPTTQTRPVGTVSGFAPNPVSGFTPGVVSGFSRNPVSGFTPALRTTFQPGTIAPLSTTIGGVGTNSHIIPQQPIGTLPGNDTNRFLFDPLF